MERTIKGGKLKQNLMRGENQDKEQDKVKMEKERERESWTERQKARER